MLFQINFGYHSTHKRHDLHVLALLQDPSFTHLQAYLLLDHLQVRYIGVSNETSYGVMRFVQVAEQSGLPKIVSIQNSYSLLVRNCLFRILSQISVQISYSLLVCDRSMCLSPTSLESFMLSYLPRDTLRVMQVRSAFEADLVEVCSPRQCNVGLLAYSPLAGGSLSGKYVGGNPPSGSRLTLFPGKHIL